MKALFVHISFSLFFIISSIHAQEQQRKWQLNGYIKDLQTVFLNKVQTNPGGKDSLILFHDNLIHNRLNFKWYPNEKFTLVAQMRNRIFWGDFVKLNPMYAENIDHASNDILDLSALIVNNPNLVIHSVFDRLYAEFANENWEVRLGRQRINWGINTIWNPNDIFNAYNFTDFDYEERPGSDALRVKYYLDFASSIEFAVKAFEDFEETVMAAMYKWNYKTYDFQILGGIFNYELVLGGGWAGNLKNAGFKGEWSTFYPLNEDIDPSFAATMSIDYTLKKGTYLSGGFLYNSNGENPEFLQSIFNFELSAKNLYPWKYSLLVQASHPFTPLLNGSLAVIYSPSNTNALFVNPIFTYSIANNWNLDILGQIIFGKENNLGQDESFGSSIQALFARFKYSF